MSREDCVKLIARAHRCAMDQAEEILADIEAGKREVIAAAALSKKAGVRHSALGKTTRPLSRVSDLGVSLEWPTRPGQHRDNGQG